MPDVGIGAVLAVNDGASQAFVDFNNTVKLTLPKLEGQVEESTPLSPAEMWKEFVSKKLIDPGTLKYEGWFTKLDYNRLLPLLMKTFITGTTRVQWRMRSPDLDASGTATGLQMLMNGILTVIDEVEFAKESLMMVKFEVKVSGKPTFSDAANNPTMPTPE